MKRQEYEYLQQVDHINRMAIEPLVIDDVKAMFNLQIASLPNDKSKDHEEKYIKISMDMARNLSVLKAIKWKRYF